jgi:tRNA(Ile)-lysidine synthase
MMKVILILLIAENFIRHEIIPKLREVWPHACKKIAETANICQDSSDNLFELGLLDGTNSDMSLSYRRQLNAIRAWLKQQEVLMPSQAVLDEIYQLLCSKQDSEGVVKFSHYSVYRYKNKLYLEKSQLPHISDRVWQDIQTPFCIPEMGITLPIPNLNLKTSKKIEIRFRKGGELFYFRGHKHRLKKLMQEEFYIPPWRRHLIPLLYIDNVFAALYVITASNEAVGWTYSSLF